MTMMTVASMTVVTMTMTAVTVVTMTMTAVTMTVTAMTMTMTTAMRVGSNLSPLYKVTAARQKCIQR